MEKYFLNLNKEQFEELNESLDAICEENEKFPVNAIFFLTTVIESCCIMIDLCEEIFQTKKFIEDHNYLCARGMTILNIKTIIERNLLPEKEKELKNLFPVVDKALDLQDDLIDKRLDNIKTTIKIHKFLYQKTKQILKELIEKENILEKYNQTDIKNHLQLTAFLMNSGKFGTEIYQFFLNTFIYGKEKIAA